MKTPGITVRPIITLGGEHEVNEVWLEDVRVPVENRVYEENKGWTCAKFLLAHERTALPASRPPSAASSASRISPVPNRMAIVRCSPTPSSSARWPSCRPT
jgi:hypothetical protein